MKQSLLRPKAYIVSQGPNEHTVGDFWQMIWQEDVHIIIMLTKVYEFIRVMCTQYWPTRIDVPEYHDGGRYEVTLVDEDCLADYVVRTIRIVNVHMRDQMLHSNVMDQTTTMHKDPHSHAHSSDMIETDLDIVETDLPSDNPFHRSASRKHSNRSSSSMHRQRINLPDQSKPLPPHTRILYQLHFVSWQQNSCPYSDAMLKFRRRAQIYEKQCRDLKNGNGPVLVHCR